MKGARPGAREQEGVYEWLREVARRKGTTNYTEAGQKVGLGARDRKLFAILYHISKQEHEQHRPLLSAVVVSKGNPRAGPGEGFYLMVKDVGIPLPRGPEARWLFWRRELGLVHSFWGDPRP